MPQEDIISDKIDLRHEDSQANRQSHVEDVPVGDRNLICLGVGQKDDNLHRFVVLLHIVITMLKPAFTIEASGISDEDLLQCRLLVEVTPNAFTYVLLNQRNMSPLVVKYFQLEQNKENPLPELLRDIMEADELLKRPVK